MPSKTFRPIKKLNCTDEEFFHEALLLLGVPQDHQLFEYSQKGYLYRGTSAWIKFDPEGQKFLELLTSHGEAKARATKWYHKFRHWQRGSKYREIRR